MLIDLVNALVDWPEFNDLTAGLSYKSAIRGAAVCIEAWCLFARFFDAIVRSLGECLGWTKEGVASMLPVNVIIDIILIQGGFDLMLQVLSLTNGAIAKVEIGS